MSFYSLHPDEFEKAVEKINKINDRAVARGFTGTVEIEGHFTTKFDQSRQVEFTVVETTITGAAPCYGGYEFLAAVDELKDAHGEPLFVLRYSPGVEEIHVDRSVLRSGYCAHCRSNRARIHTFLVRHIETGELTQVGSTCLKDFLGWNTSPVFISGEDVERELGVLSGPPPETPRTVVAIAYAAASLYGWHPRSEIGPVVATADVVSIFLHGRGRDADSIRADLKPIVSYEQADEIIAAVLADNSESEYSINLRTALSARYVTGRQFGIIASAVKAHKTIQEQAAKRKAEQERREARKPEWKGHVGESIEVTGIVTVLRDIETQWNTSTLCVIEAADATYKTFGTSKWLRDRELKAGAEVTITGTVKAHETYRDEPQTVLTRTKRR